MTNLNENLKHFLDWLCDIRIDVTSQQNSICPTAALAGRGRKTNKVPDKIFESNDLLFLQDNICSTISLRLTECENYIKKKEK